MATTMTDLEAYLDANRERRLESYKTLLRFPSISALPQHASDCRRCAEHIAAELSAIGVEHVEVAETGGHPVVYGDWLHAEGQPTILVYAHYDVQPVDPVDLWTSPPFEPVVHDGRILARGAADDKSHVHMHLRATEALLATRGALPVNLRFLFEGEEESSSENLDRWLETNKERLKADVAVISDTGFFEGNLPAITLGLRGLMYAQIDVTGSPVDLHSGGFGGAVENPANALARIIAELKDRNGRVLIPGFYDDVVELTAEERAAIAALPFDEDAYRKALGLPALAGEEGFSVLERKGARPTLDVNGIWGGFQGEGTKTIIPAHAHAKVSARLVPDMDPKRTFDRVRDRVMALAPKGVNVEMKLINDGMWTATPIDHPATIAAADVIQDVFGARPFLLREGGSVPAASSFATILGLPVVLIGFTNPDARAHAPNESMVLANYEGGTRA